MEQPTKTPYERVIRLLRNHIKLTRNQTSMTEELLDLIIQGENPPIPGTESTRSAPSYNVSERTHGHSLQPSPTPSRELSLQRSQTPIESSGHHQLCIRCFMRWKAFVETGNMEVPPCTFAVSGRRKKCEYCSSRRSACNIVS